MIIIASRDISVGICEVRETGNDQQSSQGYFEEPFQTSGYEMRLSEEGNWIQRNCKFVEEYCPNSVWRKEIRISKAVFYECFDMYYCSTMIDILWLLCKVTSILDISIRCVTNIMPLTNFHHPFTSYFH